MTDEFDLIERIRREAGSGGKGVVVGIGDDAAILAAPAGRELVVTTDTLNEGVHFDGHLTPAELGYKCLAVNLSDLAAMGADPHWALLSLSLPEISDDWLDGFLGGFLALAGEHGVRLVGGDSCAGGSRSVSVVALGSVEPGMALRRDGAQPGDLVVVSGTLGGAACALEMLRSGSRPRPRLREKLARPRPRVGLGRALVGKATACIDISDGLLADLAHVAGASGCGALIELDELPSEQELAERPERERWNLQLGGGEDYELCFTWPSKRKAELSDMADKTQTSLTVIGRMDRDPGVRCVGPGGRGFEAPSAGYRHFR